jgi:hypothetical protein
MRKRSTKLTNEEKVAQKIDSLISDVRLDIDSVGMYFGQMSSITGYYRLENIVESAREEREYNGKRIWDN